MKKISSLLFSLFIVCAAVKSEVRLPRFVSDGMVLQRNQTVSIWGWADPGEKITIRLNGKIYKVQAGENSQWKVDLKAQPAGGPFVMEISGHNKIILKDILFGDVWLCSGQSNMEAVMGRSNIKAFYVNEIATSTNSLIRQFAVVRTMAFKPADDVLSEKGWVSANPETVLNFSAVGYFFAKELYQKYKVPIGLILSSAGGTPVQSWVNSESLTAFPDYYAVANNFKDDAMVEKLMLDHTNKTKAWEASVKAGDQGTNENWSATPYGATSAWTLIDQLSNWRKQFPAPVYGVVWFKTVVDIPAALAGKSAELKLGFMHTEDETYINGKKAGATKSGYTLRNYKVEPGILRAGENVITIRLLSPTTGVSFENNQSCHLKFGTDSIDLSGKWKYRVGIEKELLPRGNGISTHTPTAYYYPMIHPLAGYGIKGIIWYQGESNVPKPEQYSSLFTSLITSWRKDWKNPVLPFLYVQLANYCKTPEEPVVSSWALLREAQTSTLALPFTGMAVIHDIGEKDDIHPRNKQDVGKRLALAARKMAYKENIVYSGPIYKSMKIIGNKVTISFNHIGTGLKCAGDQLNSFSISADGKNFIKAQAVIKGDKVVVWNDHVIKPVAVRYAWADSPDGANLYNREGLPASGFRITKLSMTPF